MAVVLGKEVEKQQLRSGLQVLESVRLKNVAMKFVPSNVV
jgi:hypothetical protein